MSTCIRIFQSTFVMCVQIAYCHAANCGWHVIDELFTEWLNMVFFSFLSNAIRTPSRSLFLQFASSMEDIEKLENMEDMHLNVWKTWKTCICILENMEK